MSSALTRRQSFSLQQAAEAEPSLAALQARVRESQHCLQHIQHLIPINLRQHVKAGPIDGGEWCLLVSSAAASTKLRQLLPALLQTLSQGGAQVNAIRIKVQAAPR